MLSTIRSFKYIILETKPTPSNIEEIVINKYKNTVSYIGIIESVKFLNKTNLFISPDYTKNSNIKFSAILDLKYFIVPKYFYIPNCKIINILDNVNGIKILLDCELSDLEGNVIESSKSLGIILTSINKSSETIKKFRLLNKNDTINLQCIGDILVQDCKLICNCDLFHKIEPILVKYENLNSDKFLFLDSLPDNVKDIFIIPSKKEKNLIDGEEYLFCITGFYSISNTEFQGINFIKEKQEFITPDNEIKNVIGYNDVQLYLENVLYNWKLLAYNNNLNKVKII